MASLTVWAFDDADHARTVLRRLETAAKQGVIQLDDAAIVSWPTGAKRPKTQQLHSMVGVGATGGAFWGMLFGLIFLAPLAGAAIGAAAGGAAGAFADVGIDDDFIKQVRDEVTPGSSALFVMASNAVVDKIRDVFEGTNARLLQTNLSEEQERELKSQFHLVD
jgi:uncharacterized membrane protein